MPIEHLDMHPSELPKDWRADEPLSARKLTQTVKVVRRLVQGVQPPRQQRHPMPQTITARFRVHTVSEDYLVCHRIDRAGNVGSEDEYVAKPWMNRQTPFDGQTRNGITYTYSSVDRRTADDGANTEIQVLNPSYVADFDEIIARRNMQGGTGVSIDLGGGRMLDVEWEDTNETGRAWAKEYS